MRQWSCFVKKIIELNVLGSLGVWLPSLTIRMFRNLLLNTTKTFFWGCPLNKSCAPELFLKVYWNLCSRTDDRNNAKIMADSNRNRLRWAIWLHHLFNFGIILAQLLHYNYYSIIYKTQTATLFNICKDMSHMESYWKNGCSDLLQKQHFNFFLNKYFHIICIKWK